MNLVTISRKAVGWAGPVERIDPLPDTGKASFWSPEEASCFRTEETTSGAIRMPTSWTTPSPTSDSVFARSGRCLGGGNASESPYSTGLCEVRMVSHHRRVGAGPPSRNALYTFDLEPFP
jgi:hypothetical protein